MEWSNLILLLFVADLACRNRHSPLRVLFLIVGGMLAVFPEAGLKMWLAGLFLIVLVGADRWWDQRKLSGLE